jgi:prophage tail gpP-like protein
VSGSRSGRFQDRFSEYVVKGQSAGDDTWFGDAAAGTFARVTDARVERYRPLVTIPDGQGPGKPDLERNAKWLRNVRAGRSKRLAYTLDGWRHASAVWEPNTLVEVDDPELDVKGEYLVARVDLMQGPRGIRAGLELAHPDAYQLLADPGVASPADNWGAW